MPALKAAIAYNEFYWRLWLVVIESLVEVSSSALRTQATELGAMAPLRLTLQKLPPVQTVCEGQRCQEVGEWQSWIWGSVPLRGFVTLHNIQTSDALGLCYSQSFFPLWIWFSEKLCSGVPIFILYFINSHLSVGGGRLGMGEFWNRGQENLNNPLHPPNQHALGPLTPSSTLGLMTSDKAYWVRGGSEKFWAWMTSCFGDCHFPGIKMTDWI